MIKYVQKNVNPKGKKTADCVIRALTVATGKDYWEVFDELVVLAKKTGLMINEKRLYEKFLDQNGFFKYPQPRKLDNTKYQVGELDEVCKCSNRVIIVTMANHMTVVFKGELIDIWDCRGKTISNYFTKLIQ